MGEAPDNRADRRVGQEGKRAGAVTPALTSPRGDNLATGFPAAPSVTGASHGARIGLRALISRTPPSGVSAQTTLFDEIQYKGQAGREIAKDCCPCHIFGNNLNKPRYYEVISPIPARFAAFTLHPEPDAENKNPAIAGGVCDTSDWRRAAGTRQRLLPSRAALLQSSIGGGIDADGHAGGEGRVRRGGVGHLVLQGAATQLLSPSMAWRPSAVLTM